MTQAVVIADTDGVITQFSAGAQLLFGHPAEKAIGSTLDLLVPEPFLEAHWACFERAMAAPEVKDMAADLPVVCADGETRTFTGRLVILSDG